MRVIGYNFIFEKYIVIIFSKNFKILIYKNILIYICTHYIDIKLY